MQIIDLHGFCVFGGLVFGCGKPTLKRGPIPIVIAPAVEPALWLPFSLASREKGPGDERTPFRPPG
jgi:hypothetical protein